MIQRSYRVAIGLTLIGSGIVVAILGYLGVSDETEVAFQLPYFASAAVAALMLLGLGAALLLSVQLDRDAETLGDLEQAVRDLASEVGRLSEQLDEPRGAVGRTRATNGKGSTRVRPRS